MEIRISNSKKHDQDEKKMLKSMKEDEEIIKRTYFSSKEVEHKNALVRNAKISNKTENCTQEPFVRYMQTLDRRIPKHIITLDEKYIRFCFELVYVNATRGTSCRYAYDSSDFVNCFSLEAGIIGHKPIRTSTKRKSGVNLLKHPLFRQSVGSENSIVDGGSSVTDTTKSAIDTISTSSQLSISSLPTLGNKTAIFENERLNLEMVHKRHISFFSVLDNFKRGMIHCSLKAGIPRYVFSLDDRNEVYIANMIKPEPSKYIGFDYLYTFYSKEAHLVGKMRVSTSFTFCRNNSEIKETEFVLFGEEERDMREVQTSTSVNVKKSSGFSKRMTEVFKTSHTSRERAAYKYDVTNEKPSFDLLTNWSTNLELASVITKDHVCDTHREPEVAGWGMKFLKKIVSRNANSSIGTSPSPCEYFVENKGDCSTRTNIIIPASFHGLPINRFGGPTSLVERWRKGGKCDCGGWDIGCPIKVLETKRSKNENASQVDIRVSGKKDSALAMKMVSLLDGLYVVNFESNLSALQSFAIAVSMISKISFFEV